MKKVVVCALALMLLVLPLTGCGGEKTNDGQSQSQAEANGTKDAKEDATKAIIVINGNLGDRTFFDAAYSGVTRLMEDYDNLEIKAIETGGDTAKWEPAVADAAEEDVDFVICISPAMGDILQEVAPQYPDQKFLLLDAEVDYSTGDVDNVYCATFAQNEGSFLAGALAGMISENNKIGFVGGMDTPSINDFLVGYIEGAQYVNPQIKVVPTYIGDYYDPAKGKEFGLVLADQGVEVIFGAASESGLGAIEASKERKVPFIGVDSDQSQYFADDGDAETAEIIVSSMMKYVGEGIYQAVSMELEGTCPYGTHVVLGIAEGGVGLAKNDVYNRLVPDEVKSRIEEIEREIIDGKIEISSAIGMSQSDLDALRSSVAP